MRNGDFDKEGESLRFVVELPLEDTSGIFNIPLGGCATEKSSARLSNIKEAVKTQNGTNDLVQSAVAAETDPDPL